MTDSAYTIGVLSKGHQASANAELVAVIRQDLALRPSVTFEHVYGHEGNEANEIADKMANIGRKYVTKITPIL